MRAFAAWPRQDNEVATGVMRANSIALLVGRLITAATTFAVAVMAARSLGEEFGRVAAIVAAGFVLSTLLAFGSDTLIVRATARDPHGTGTDVAGPVLAMQLGISAILAAAAGVGYAVGAVTAGVAIQAFVLLPQAVVFVAAAVLRGRDDMGRLVVATAVGGVAAVVGTAVLLNDASEVWAPIAGLAIGHVITAALMGFWARLRLRLPASIHEVRALFTVTSAFAVMVAATTVSTHIAVVILGGFGVLGAAGFAAATRFVDAARLFPAATYSAAFPSMADRIHRRPTAFDRSRRLLYIAGAATIILIAAAEPLSTAVFGDLDRGPELLRILALGVVPIVLRQRLSFELIAAGQESHVARAAAGTALFMVVGSLLTVSAGASGNGAQSDGTVVTIVAWLHTVATMLNVLVLDRFNRRPASAMAMSRERANR